MMAAAQNVQNISQSGGLRGSYNANTARQWRNWLLSSGIEQSFRLQLGLELLEGDLQRPGALRLKIFGGELQVAFVFIDGYSPAQHDLHPVLGAEAQQPGLRTEHDGANLGVSIFQCEIKVSGVMCSEI